MHIDVFFSTPKKNEVENFYGETFHRLARVRRSLPRVRFAPDAVQSCGSRTSTEAAQSRRSRALLPRYRGSSATLPSFSRRPPSSRRCLAAVARPPLPGHPPVLTPPSPRNLRCVRPHASAPSAAPHPIHPRPPEPQQPPPRSPQTLTSPPSMASLMPPSPGRSALTQSCSLPFSPRVRTSGQHVQDWQ
jgi:hypothetical protein